MRKRGLALLLALALTLALAGCRGEVTAESLYEEAAQTWRKADRVSSRASSSVSSDGVRPRASRSAGVI